MMRSRMSEPLSSLRTTLARPVVRTRQQSAGAPSSNTLAFFLTATERAPLASVSSSVSESSEKGVRVANDPERWLDPVDGARTSFPPARCSTKWPADAGRSRRPSSASGRDDSLRGADRFECASVGAGSALAGWHGSADAETRCMATPALRQMILLSGGKWYRSGLGRCRQLFQRSRSEGCCLA